MSSPETTLADVRGLEIEATRAWFRRGASVLELGGGNGYQAKLIAGWGCDVVSIDVGGRPSHGAQYFPVQEYDGLHIPFPAARFDIAFSSCVLEHVPNLAGILGEVHRVLAPGGVAIHVVPSPAWRFWTSISHYAFLLKHLPGFLQRDPGNPAAQLATDLAEQYGLLRTLRLAAFPIRHGEYPSSLHELYYYRRRRWHRVFSANGFDVVQTYGNALFYTGCGILNRSLSQRSRRKLAHVLGSSMYVFVTQKRR